MWQANGLEATTALGKTWQGVVTLLGKM